MDGWTSTSGDNIESHHKIKDGNIAQPFLKGKVMVKYVDTNSVKSTTGHKNKFKFLLPDSAPCCWNHYVVRVATEAEMPRLKYF